MPSISSTVPLRLRLATALVLICGHKASSQEADPPVDPGSQVRRNPSTTFAKVVESHFAKWDLNHDGILEASEIDALMNRQDIRGEAAAALAAIKRRERAIPLAERAQYTASMDQLTGPASDPEPVEPSSPRRIVPYELVFRHNVRTLSTLNRKLFAGDGPNFREMKQGPIGDCYFFSLTGYLAAREPKKLMRMITPEPDGGYLVQFFDGEQVRVAAPTDAEILVNNSASSLDDGIWLAVLEKALGKKMRRLVSAPKRTSEATDAMALGGTTGLMIRLYSGHQDTKIRLRESRYVRPRLDLLRRILPQILARGMLASAEMGKKPLEGLPKTPGLGYGHAYAILGYDPATDRIMLWNPWGQNFTPSGPEGYDHGFSTDHGIFQLSLRDFYYIFSSVHLETFSRAIQDDGPVHGFYGP